MAKGQRKKDTRNQELEQQLKRALADYANLQRRTEVEKSQLIDYFRSTFAVKFLPILDNLEAALGNLTKEGAEATRQGLELSVKQFKKILQDQGIEEIEAEGVFDPTVHEAVEVVEGKADNKIIKIVEKGYRLGSKILRPVKVKVEKKKP